MNPKNDLNNLSDRCWKDIVGGGFPWEKSEDGLTGVAGSFLPLEMLGVVFIGFGGPDVSTWFGMIRAEPLGMILLLTFMA